MGQAQQKFATSGPAPSSLMRRKLWMRAEKGRRGGKRRLPDGELADRRGGQHQKLIRLAGRRFQETPCSP